MALRKGTWHDWSRINEIFREELPIVPSEERRYMIQSLLDGTTVWELNNCVSAFLIADYKKYHSVAWVEYLAVEEAVKCTGIAKSLMAHFEMEAKKSGKGWVALSTFRKNTRAVGFYTKIGYEPCDDTIDEKIIFFKPLDGSANFPALTPTGAQLNPFRMRFRRILFDCVV